MFRFSGSGPATDPGILSRRSLLLGGTATLLGTGLALAGASGAHAATPSAAPAPPRELRYRPAEAGAPRILANAAKVKNLSGPNETGRFAAPWTDLGIPVRCPNGSLFFACGDTFDGGGVGGPDWRAPVGLRSGNASLDGVLIDGAVGGSHANGLVPEGHVPVDGGATTAIPSDVFTIGNTMYMHLMRGLIYRTDHTDFWRSTDNGETWEYLCQWPADALGGQFQQKTYAVGADGYCYVLSTIFNRDIASGLLLHRVRHADVGNPAAYQPWGYANGAWAWGNAPTTISAVRKWGEICFRSLGDRYAFTWLNMNPLDIRAALLTDPTANLMAAPEQTMIVPTTPGNEGGNAVAYPYGGFIFPGSTVDNFHICVSQWFDNQNYRFMQYRVSGLG